MASELYTSRRRSGRSARKNFRGRAGRRICKPYRENEYRARSPTSFIIRIKLALRRIIFTRFTTNIARTHHVCYKSEQG